MPAVTAWAALGALQSVRSINRAVLLVHGDEVLADSEADGGQAAANAKFKRWVRQHYFGEA